tara:strand:+ start:5009 stop:5656 length:648 start_codon:yes stop_codon:yes gene_type:complete
VNINYLNQESIRRIRDYYDESIQLNGVSAKGVDWNKSEDQINRYLQLLNLIQGDNLFSILDYGCGYGALVKILEDLKINFDYIGLDISPLMIKAAKDLYQDNDNVTFENGSDIHTKCDYILASGVFNVKLETADALWRKYVVKMLDEFNKYSNKGFAFNCLSSYSDLDKQSTKLFYANPLELFDVCKKKYSDNVSLIHNYGLYEFTILVNKSTSV